MNPILLSVIGLLAVFISGVVVYGLVGASSIGENKVALTVPRFLVAGAGMFVIAYSFLYLFNNVTLGDMTGVSKGLALGALVSIPFFAVPLFADAPYFKSSKAGIEWIVIANWVVSFLALGLVIGLWA